jgi:hypothetical protein
MISRLPNAGKATIKREKIMNYLLAFDHPQGRGKALFFSRFGFTADRWHDLSDALLNHARECKVIETLDNAFGRKYIVEGPLSGLDGRAPIVRAVWFIAEKAQSPVFVTAFPGKEGQQ